MHKYKKKLVHSWNLILSTNAIAGRPMSLFFDEFCWSGALHFFHQFTEYFAASDSHNFNHKAKFAFDSVDSGDILPIVENINMKKATGPDKFLHKQSRKTNVFQFQF